MKLVGWRLVGWLVEVVMCVELNVLQLLLAERFGYCGSEAVHDGVNSDDFFY